MAPAQSGLTFGVYKMALKPVQKIEGSGNILRLTNSAGQLVEIEGLLSAPRPHVVIDPIDVTDQNDEAVASFIGGKATPAQVSYDVYHDPGSDQDLMLTEHAASREVRPYQVEEKTGRVGERRITDGNLLVVSYVPDSAEIGGSRKATLTVQPSGLATGSSTP